MGLVTAGSYAQEINDRYPIFERLAKPSIVGGVWILSHEGVVDRLVALENLPVHLGLVIIPDLAAWFWKGCGTRIRNQVRKSMRNRPKCGFMLCILYVRNGGRCDGLRIRAGKH
jgi:hypothetical protein